MLVVDLDSFLLFVFIHNSVCVYAHDCVCVLQMCMFRGIFDVSFSVVIAKLMSCTADPEAGIAPKVEAGKFPQVSAPAILMWC